MLAARSITVGGAVRVLAIGLSGSSRDIAAVPAMSSCPRMVFGGLGSCGGWRSRRLLILSDRQSGAHCGRHGQEDFQLWFHGRVCEFAAFWGLCFRSLFFGFVTVVKVYRRGTFRDRFSLNPWQAVSLHTSVRED